jgi:hypothetical protein
MLSSLQQLEKPRNVGTTLPIVVQSADFPDSDSDTIRDEDP